MCDPLGSFFDETNKGNDVKFTCINLNMVLYIIIYDILHRVPSIAILTPWRAPYCHACPPELRATGRRGNLADQPNLIIFCSYVIAIKFNQS